jgi:hypothetical protein
MLQRAILHHPSQSGSSTFFGWYGFFQHPNKQRKKIFSIVQKIYQYETESSKHQDSNYVFRMLVDLVGFVTFCELQLQIPNLLKLVFNNPILSSLNILVAYL